MPVPSSNPKAHPVKESVYENDGDHTEQFPLSRLGEKRTDRSSASRSNFLDPSALRRLCLSPSSQDERLTRRTTRGLSPTPKPLSTSAGFRSWCSRQCARNRGPGLVALASFFGALMNVFAGLLQRGEDGMQPMQVLLVRQAGTTILACLYMWWKRVPSAPMGPKGTRRLLLLRGFAGFFGIYGMWCSIKGLPLAEATVISFLGPNLAGYLCYVFLAVPFTKTEQLASLVSLVGVMLITRPVTLFFGTGHPSAPIAAVERAINETTTLHSVHHAPTDAERLSAVAMGLLGVLGGAGALTAIRAIGKRGHPLISVTYFSAWSTVVAVTALSVAPAIDYKQPEFQFALPSSPTQWILLAAITFSGFVLQFLLTAGLSAEKSNRATAMIYTQVLFATGFDRWIFGQQMSWASLAGCVLVVGSALWVALTKEEGEPRQDVESAGMSGDEAVPLMEEGTGNGDDEAPSSTIRR